MNTEVFATKKGVVVLQAKKGEEIRKFLKVI